MPELNKDENVEMTKSTNEETQMSELNKDQIMEALDERGAEFNKRDTKAVLAEMLSTLEGLDGKPIEGELMTIEDSKYLKNKHTGLVFNSTPKLKKMAFMVEATEDEYIASRKG
jgi:hypothetical protein